MATNSLPPASRRNFRNAGVQTTEIKESSLTSVYVDSTTESYMNDDMGSVSYNGSNQLDSYHESSPKVIKDTSPDVAHVVQITKLTLDVVSSQDRSIENQLIAKVSIKKGERGTKLDETTILQGCVKVIKLITSARLPLLKAEGDLGAFPPTFIISKV